MVNLFAIVGPLVGVAGVLVCLFAAVVRLLGYYHVLGVEAESLFILGTALMVAACLAKLETIAAAVHDRGAKTPQ